MSKKITVFTRTTCAPCKMLKSYFRSKDISFNEIDIDLSPAAAQQAYDLAGYSIVPLTVIDSDEGKKEVIAGFNLQKIIPAIN